MRLIDAENANLIDAIGRNAFRNRQDIIELINNQPTVDAIPTVYGRWVHLGGDEWCCSVCGFVITTEGSWDKPTKKVLRGLWRENGWRLPRGVRSEVIA